MAEFHFLRPLWLLALPAGAVLIWLLLRARLAGGAWQRLVAPALQRVMLLRPDVIGDQRWPFVLALAVLLLGALALAGPAWERQPVQTFRANDALVIAMDLSRSMDATDITPSRLSRAKLKLLNLLERRAGGEVALVVFSSHAFAVAPLTTDARTVASLVTSLQTDIMPSQGSYPAAGLEKSAALLRQAAAGEGQILLITDSAITDDELVAARDLRAAGISVSVLAVGTEQGAPIPDARAGGFVTDGAGRVVVPRLEFAGLQRLAQTGGGRFAQLSPDDRDLDVLFPETALGGLEAAARDDEELSADVWLDQGIWAVLLLLPLVAAAFRRGWVCGLLVAVLIAPPPAAAFEWADLWRRPDQRGAAALQDGDAERAAQLFEDPNWRAVAEYRAADFPSSAAALEGLDSVAALYNRGNALAKAGQLQPALDAYDAVLGLEPEHEDAIYNRQLVEELLQQQQEQQEQQEQGESEQQQQSADAGDSGEQQEEGESQDSDSESDAAQSETENAASNDSDSQAPEDAEQRDGEREEEQLAENEPGEDEPRPQAMAVPEEVEEWASDQAADQWLRRIPQDPGGLLRRKFLYQYQRMGVDQDGNFIWPAEEAEPW